MTIHMLYPTQDHHQFVMPEMERCTSIYGLLPSLYSYLSLARDDFRHFHSLLHNLTFTRPYNPADHPPFLRFFSREISSSQYKLHCPGFPNGMRKTLGASSARYNSQIDFRLAKFCCR